jgi:hypothetical protein
MVKEHDPDGTTHKRVTYRNIARIESIGKMGESFNDVITKLLDDYERRQKRKQKIQENKKTK